jgi:ribulose-phosphate 3-epimerase
VFSAKIKEGRRKRRVSGFPVSLINVLPTTVATATRKRPDHSSELLAGRSSSMPLGTRLRRLVTWLAWRYRYLAGFIVFGFLSIVLEVVLIGAVFPKAWPGEVTSVLAFVAGMLFAFYMNARFNFHVSHDYFLRTFFLFAAISAFSYLLNLAAAHYLVIPWTSYPVSRFFTAGCLFMVAYYLHRRITFRNITRNLGLALYVREGDELQRAYDRIGDQCDHVHFDLVDSTFDVSAAPVELGKIAAARQLWTWQPFCLHVMSKTPLRWIEQCWQSVDWIVLHVDVLDDVMEVIASCRQWGRRVGIVWHESITLAQMLPYLPHVDFVVVLGIAQPGRSGQVMTEESLQAAALLNDMASRYGYELIFDGGVTTDNVDRIPAQILVSSSHVLQAENPIHAALALRSGGQQ